MFIKGDHGQLKLGKQSQFPPPPTGASLYVPYYPPLGATVTDHSGQGNTGTIVGTTWARDPHRTWLLSYDGNDYVNHGINASLLWGIQTAYTIIYWVKSTSVALSLHTVGNQVSRPAFNDLFYYGGQLNRPVAGKIQVWMKDSVNQAIQVASTNVIGWNNGLWHMITVKKAAGATANTVKCRIDKTNIPLTINIDTNPANDVPVGNFLTGGVDSNGALSGNYVGEMGDVIVVKGTELSVAQCDYIYDRFKKRHNI